MLYNFNRPSISEHFVLLRIAALPAVPRRDGLQSGALGRGQAAVISPPRHHVAAAAHICHVRRRLAACIIYAVLLIGLYAAAFSAWIELYGTLNDYIRVGMGSRTVPTCAANAR